MSGTTSVSSAKRKSYLKEGLFLAGVAGLGIIGGFMLTVSRVKRRNPASFMKGMVAAQEVEQLESGTSVGLRALGWGSFFAVAGVGTLTMAVCKIMGVHSVDEFRIKFQSVAPAVRRNDDLEETEATSRELQSVIFEEDSDG